MTKHRKRPYKGVTAQSPTISPIEKSVPVKPVPVLYPPRIVTLTQPLAKRKPMQTKRPVFIRWLGRKAKGLRRDK